MFGDITARNSDNNVESVQYQKSTYRMRVSFYSDYFEIDSTSFYIKQNYCIYHFITCKPIIPLLILLMYRLYSCAWCDSANQYIYPGSIIGLNIIYDIQKNASAMFQNRIHQWQMKSRTIAVHFTSTHNTGITPIPDPFNIKSLLLSWNEYNTRRWYLIFIYYKQQQHCCVSRRSVRHIFMLMRNFRNLIHDRSTPWLRKIGHPILTYYSIRYK